MSLETINFRFEGNNPLICHNGQQLADPLSAISKELKVFSGKRKKTDDDHRAMRDLEFLGSVYTDKPVEFTRNGSIIQITNGVRLIMPAENIWRAFYDSAKFSKSGPRVKEGLLVQEDSILETSESFSKMFGKLETYAFRRLVRVQQAAVMRTRCMLRQWSFEATIHFQNDRLDRQQVVEMAENAGKYVGLGDWRPRYGTFVSEVVNGSKAKV